MDSPLESVCPHCQAPVHVEPDWNWFTCPRCNEKVAIARGRELSIQFFVGFRNLTFNKLNTIMAAIEDVNAKLDTVLSTVTQIGSDLSVAFTDYKAQVANEQAKLSQATNQPVADLTATEAKIDTILAGLNAIETSVKAGDPGAEVATAPPVTGS